MPILTVHKRPAKLTRVAEFLYTDTLLPEYASVPLLPSLKRALLALTFTKPTPIQARTFAAVIAQNGSVATKDVVGIAQTGSGKTLAYSMPILQEILRSFRSQETPSLTALVLCPTRELALQVRQHMGQVVHHASVGVDTESMNGKGKAKAIPRANIVTVCGGLSAEKQKRLLSSAHGVDVIVATPGRMWDLIQEDAQIAQQIRQCKFLVLDEADRMIENGHFAELENIVALTKRKAPSLPVVERPDQTAFENDFEDLGNEMSTIPARQDMRTYVFSATMSKDLQTKLKRKTSMAASNAGGSSALDDLLAKLDFRDPAPTVIDLTPESGTVSTLKEIAVECLLKEKDVYLYYFLLRFPGRTLVFFSSIDAIRRLQPLLALLKVNSAVIHSGMQQRARLKALDRFKTADSMALLATDVAARGLDIPTVDHVIHYQLPRTADTYIHRSGRTARAGKEGISLQLCCPEEKRQQRSLLTALKRTKQLASLDVDFSVYEKLSARVDLAKRVEVAQHRSAKSKHEEDWFRKAAEDMEIAYGSDASDSDHGRGRMKNKKRRAESEVEQLKVQLASMLAQPLSKRGISGKYLTSSSNGNFARQMLSGETHDKLLGMPSTTALDALR